MKVRPPPERNETLRGTCIAARCYADSVALHWDPDPHPTARYCRYHAWMSWAWRVNLDDIRVEMGLEARANASLKTGGLGDSELFDNTGGIGESVARKAGVIGERAAQRLLGGRLKGPGRGADLNLGPEVGRLEVKTACKHWPFRRRVPAASLRHDYLARLEDDVLLCVCPMFLQPHEPLDAYVVAWCPRPKIMMGAKRFGSFILAPWHPGRWRNVAELM